MTPKVSVILPVYNAETTLEACLGDILGQTFTDFEVVAVDDGSSDASGAILARVAAGDDRLRILSPGRNLGVAAASNMALAAARAPLVARMDADDRMAVERLEKQWARFHAQPALDGVACRVRLFPEEAVTEGFQRYIDWQNACLTHGAIADERYVELPVANPTLMLRRARILELGGWRRGDFPEDYELILRLLEAGARMEKLPEILVDWRESDGRLTRTDPAYSRAAFNRVRMDYLARDSRVTSGRPLAFWGAGRRTRRRVDPLRDKGIAPAAWIDIDPKKIGNRIEGVPVVAPEWLDGAGEKPFVLGLVTGWDARETIRARLEGSGFHRGRDYLMVGS